MINGLKVLLWLVVALVNSEARLEATAPPRLFSARRNRRLRGLVAVHVNRT
jgi:hypothetical protein